MAESHGRKRSRVACKTCQDLKRKCDGAYPCATCRRYEYDCAYREALGPNKRPRAVSPLPGRPGNARSASGNAPSAASANAPSAAPGHVQSAAATSQNHVRSLEANSGSAFLRKLALRLDPKNAPRMHTFAWNAFLGSRRISRPPACHPITKMLTQEVMESLASVYFEKLDPIYSFVNRHDIHCQIQERWKSTTADQFQDAVLCGIAAIGLLFSQVQPMATEIDLVESARSTLEGNISTSPSLATVTAWLLRAVYLRITSTHHTAWMASCILMHLVEAAGLHCEPSEESVLPTPGEDVDAELRRRVVAVAQHLNIWMSFDMGRSRVTLCNATAIMPAPRQGDYTHELMGLLPYSMELDPERAHDAAQLDLALRAVLDHVHTVPPSILAQCNLMLCLCRRLQSMNTSFTGAVLDQILALTAKGIQSAQAILDARAPWHHMANVPFQIVCVLLAIDTLASVSQLKDAMQCLSNVASVYSTVATREALQTATLLISLHHKVKEKAVASLGDILKQYSVVPDPETENDLTVQQPENVKWLNDWAGDLFNLEQADIDRLATSLFWDVENTVL